jgi:hypothetical protein
MRKESLQLGFGEEDLRMARGGRDYYTLGKFELGAIQMRKERCNNRLGILNRAPWTGLEGSSTQASKDSGESLREDAFIAAEEEEQR